MRRAAAQGAPRARDRGASTWSSAAPWLPAGRLLVHGTARLVEGGAPELLQRLAEIYLGPGMQFPPFDNPPPGHVIRITVDRSEASVPGPTPTERGGDLMKVGLHVVNYSWPDGPTSIAPTLAATARAAGEAGVAELTLMDHWFQMEAFAPPPSR